MTPAVSLFGTSRWNQRFHGFRPIIKQTRCTLYYPISGCSTTTTVVATIVSLPPVFHVSSVLSLTCRSVWLRLQRRTSDYRFVPAIRYRPRCRRQSFSRGLWRYKRARGNVSPTRGVMGERLRFDSDVFMNTRTFIYTAIWKCIYFR